MLASAVKSFFAEVIKGVGANGSSITISKVSPSSIKMAIGELTLTFKAPSETKILPMMPSSTASNSMVALSVSISAKRSPD